MNPIARQYLARHAAPAVDLFAIVLADFSTRARRLSTVVAELATSAEPSTVTAAALADAVRGLGRVAELPMLVQQTACPVDLVAQVDAVASVAARLAAVLRGQELAHRNVSDPADRRRAGLAPDLAAGLAAETASCPNETLPSLILAGEVLSLAVRVVLVIASIARSRRRTWLACVLWRRAICWAVRVLPVVVPGDVGHVAHHLWIAGLGAVVAMVARFASRRPTRSLADALAGAVSVAAPHAFFVVMAVAGLLANGGLDRVVRRWLAGPAVRHRRARSVSDARY